MRFRYVLMYALAIVMFGSILFLMKIDRETKKPETSVSEETLSETFSETTVPEPEETEVSKADMGFYTTVTDAEGTEQVLFYLWGTDGEPALIYMQDTDDPDAIMGYMSVISRYVAAEKKEITFDSGFREFLGSLKFERAEIGYHTDRTRTGVRYTDEADVVDDVSELLKLIADIEPEFIDMPEDEIEYGYDSYHPVWIVRFDDRWSAMTNFVSVKFAMFNGRLAANCSISDYSELDKLAAKNSATEEELREAYYASSDQSSGWFYADNIDGVDKLYDKLLRTVIMSDRNEFENVRQYRTDIDGGIGFSGDIADHLYTDRSAMEGYTEVRLNDEVSFMLPSGTEPKIAGKMLTWEQDGVKLFISGSGSSFFSSDDYEQIGETYKGYFAGKKAEYKSGRMNKRGQFIDLLSFVGKSGNLYARITCESDERTDEYDTLCRNIFGSFQFIPYESAESIYGEAAPIKLSGEPSRFTDEGYTLAEGYERTRPKEAVPKFQAYVPRMLVGGFYALDYRNDYQAKNETCIEKLADDGKWYEVLPIAELNDVNGDKWLRMNNVLDYYRNTFTVDLSVYPPLPEGRYRLVKPMRLKYDHSKEYGAFMEFDMTGTDERMEISAECDKAAYDEAPDTVGVNISSEYIYKQSSYYDIEYYDGEKWTSVRTAPIEVNFSEGSYASNMDGLKDVGLSRKEIPTEGFDLSRKGKYRVRINISDDNGKYLSDSFGVLYAEFNIG